jgi:hypothetical protein
MRRITVQLPGVINFLKADNEVLLDIADLTDEELRAVGHAWTEKLIMHAVWRRANAQE